MIYKIQNLQERVGCWVFAVVLAWIFAAPAFAQDPGKKNTLASIFKDWKDRQIALKSAHYVLVGTTEFKDDSLPPGNPIRPLRFDFLLDVEKKRYRLESSQEIIHADSLEPTAKMEYRKRINTSAYDGKSLQSLRHRKANGIEDDVADLAIGKGDLGPSACFGNEIWPIFFAHGIVPTIHTPLLVDKLPLSHDPDDFDIAGQQMLRKQNCFLVRTEPLSSGAVGQDGTVFDEFWINPRQKSAIQRYVFFSGSNPWSMLDITWKNTDDGWWVDEWTETWSVSGRIRRIIHLHVETFEPNPKVSEADFALTVEPGMKVTVGENPPLGTGLDPTKPAIKTYVISASGAWNEVSAKGFTTLEGKELPPERSWTWIVWTVLVVSVVCSFLYYLLHRRNRRVAL
jgi:hypothetical protein